LPYQCGSKDFISFKVEKWLADEVREDVFNAIKDFITVSIVVCWIFDNWLNATVDKYRRSSAPELLIVEARCY
jgi:hypothetical protein